MDLAAVNAAGSSVIVFGVGAQVLRLQAGAISGGSFGNTIDDFGVGDAIDLRGLAYSGNATASFASGKLTVANGAMSVTLTLSDTPFTSSSLMDDGAGGTLVWGGSNIAPILGGDRAITVTEGSTVAVTTADLTATDADGPTTQLVYTVTGTSHGTVLKSGAPVGTFTQAELAANLISSQHDGGGVAGSFTVSLTDGDAPGQSATVAVTPWNGPVIRGTGKADQLLGGEAGELLSGLAGNDVLDGGPEGSDWLDGGTGIDTASYASSPRAVLINLPGQVTADGINTDTLVSIENAIGSAFNDTIVGNDNANRLDGGADGSDEIHGAGGSDTVSYASSTRAALINLAGQITADGVNTDTLSSIENAVGSAFNDTILGDDGPNILDGGSDGSDLIYGGGGQDTVSYASSSRAVLINLPGQITADGVNTDTLSSIEHATGSAFNDTIIGDDNANLLDGGSDGSDHIEGGGGSDTVGYASSTRAVLINLGAQLTADGVNTDTLSSIEHAIGSAFDDTILGDAGPNTLQGALGSDTLWGLGGEDTFLFGSPAEGVDRLGDFVPGLDHIGLASPFGLSSVADDDNFFASANPTPTGSGPSLLYNTTTGGLFYDADGIGAGTSLQIALLEGAPALHASDFLLI